MLTRRLFVGLGSMLAVPSAALAAMVAPSRLQEVTARPAVRVLIYKVMESQGQTAILALSIGAQPGDTLRVYRQGGYPSGYSRVVKESDISDGAASVRLDGRLSSSTGSSVYLVEVADPQGVLLASTERDISGGAI